MEMRRQEKRPRSHRLRVKAPKRKTQRTHYTSPRCQSAPTRGVPGSRTSGRLVANSFYERARRYAAADQACNQTAVSGLSDRDALLGYGVAAPGSRRRAAYADLTRERSSWLFCALDLVAVRSR